MCTIRKAIGHYQSTGLLHLSKSLRPMKLSPWTCKGWRQAPSDDCGLKTVRQTRFGSGGERMQLWVCSFQHCLLMYIDFGDNTSKLIFIYQWYLQPQDWNILPLDETVAEEKFIPNVSLYYYRKPKCNNTYLEVRIQFYCRLIEWHTWSHFTRDWNHFGALFDTWVISGFIARPVSMLHVITISIYLLGLFVAQGIR